MATAPPLMRILPAASRLTTMLLSKLSPKTVNALAPAINVAVTDRTTRSPSCSKVRVRFRLRFDCVFCRRRINFCANWWKVMRDMVGCSSLRMWVIRSLDQPSFEAVCKTAMRADRHARESCGPRWTRQPCQPSCSNPINCAVYHWTVHLSWETFRLTLQIMLIRAPSVWQSPPFQELIRNLRVGSVPAADFFRNSRAAYWAGEIVASTLAWAASGHDNFRELPYCLIFMRANDFQVAAPVQFIFAGF